jgi:Fic family protein
VELQHNMRNVLLEEGRPNSVVRLAEYLFSVPVVSASRVSRILDVTRPTAHSAIEALVERGDLEEVTGKERNRIYEAPRIFDAVYGPVHLPNEDAVPQPQLSLDLET